MKVTALAACALLALAVPAFCQSASWDTGGPEDDVAFGNTLVFADATLGMSATSWGYTRGKANDAFEAGKGIIYPTGMGVTNADEKMTVPEHQVDNAKGNDWMLIVFDSAVTDVKIVVNPYGTWDRDVTYYTANLSGPVDLAGKTYADLAALGFNPRVDDLSTKSSLARDVNIADIPGGFNAILIGAQQGKPKFGSVDRFKIEGVSANLAVPEPSVAMLGLLGGLGLLRRRR